MRTIKHKCGEWQPLLKKIPWLFFRCIDTPLIHLKLCFPCRCTHQFLFFSLSKWRKNEFPEKSWLRNWFINPLGWKNKITELCQVRIFRHNNPFVWPWMGALLHYYSRYDETESWNFLPGYVGFVPPSPSLWPVVCTCTCGFGTRFSPVTTKNPTVVIPIFRFLSLNRSFILWVVFLLSL